MSCNCGNDKTAGFSRGVVECQSDGKPGYKADYDPDWHADSKGKGGGKCFTYNPGDEAGRKSAKYKAYKQLYAIEKSLGVYTKDSSKIAELGDNIDLMDFMRWMNENFPHEAQEVQIYAKREASQRIPGVRAGTLATESLKQEITMTNYKPAKADKTTTRIPRPQLHTAGKGDAQYSGFNRYMISGQGVDHEHADFYNGFWFDEVTSSPSANFPHYGPDWVDVITYSELGTAVNTVPKALVDAAMKTPANPNAGKPAWYKPAKRKKAEDMNKNFGELGDMDFVDQTADIVSEIDSIHQKEMSDTAKSTDTDNREPEKTPMNADFEYAASVKGFKKTESKSDDIVARIMVPKQNVGRTLVGAKVLLGNPRSKKTLRGKVAAVGIREFTVLWNDSSITVEEKKNYKLV